MARRLLPTFDRILIRRFEPISKTAGGVLLPESSQKKSPLGEVIAVGPGRRSADGELVPISFQVKDKVLLPESYLSNEVELDNEKFILVKEEDIPAKVEE
eukprot:CAMPEP_0114618214 /NCGR_PEP_ID=MMETSP0168-20121206/7590_1 /TAXON_ID=95228 ORGANISM="Vannella sp., Strain DIVA3 517/6/12" /NCGR_SAMPLE_ID=MMETSP0168 /ASSEMBLY_ACC=CAM_ASM_000044 /LENGTH=99 /DNA_ID=CAMNT_0001829359 /DNA_START=103 /DNA_END=402 /DNA_ORIENTATION=-